MSMTDPIADMLTRIRNACGSKHRRVDMPLSKMKTEIARILKENDYIQDYATVETEDGKKLLRVRLKYAAGGQPVIRALERVSTTMSYAPGEGRTAPETERGFPNDFRYGLSMSGSAVYPARWFSLPA